VFVVARDQGASPLRDQVAVVTGASAGVGRAVVRELARRGVRVGLLARGEEGLAAAAAEAEQAGTRALSVPTDVSVADQVERAASLVEDELGPIAMWINAATVSVFSPTAELEPEEVERVTAVTYLGTVYGTLVALRRMRPRDQGVVVQVSSALAFRSIPFQALYCGAKHAAKGLTESLRSELLREGSNVRMTMVHLPALNTPQFDVVKSRLPRQPKPVPPIYQPEIAAEAVLWAIERSPRDLYVGFSCLTAVTANKVAPGLVDRHLARTGLEAQQTPEPVQRRRPHNLWAPVPGDHGARGRFDDEARSRSLHLLIRTHRRELVAAVGLAAGGLVALQRWRAS
jgi:short-subunit dehydrogenase